MFESIDVILNETRIFACPECGECVSICDKCKIELGKWDAVTCIQTDKEGFNFHKACVPERYKSGGESNGAD